MSIFESGVLHKMYVGFCETFLHMQAQTLPVHADVYNVYVCTHSILNQANM